MLKEASLYEKLANHRVRCQLCAHRCEICNHARGFCQVRENNGGVLYTLAYGRAMLQYSDVVEKKGLYHFHPGSVVYSFAAPGCNFRCWWCPSWEIAQVPEKGVLQDGREAPPEKIVSAAFHSGSRSIAYTCTEPTVFFEYAYDTAILAKACGLANILITNGYMTGEMLETFRPYLDAARVEIKAFRNQTYQHYCEAALQPVLDSLKAMRRMGIWVEVATTLIPGLNDGPDELRDEAGFIARELGPATPWHLTTFSPAFKMVDRPMTPDKTLRLAKEIGQEAGLYYVYLSGVPGETDLHCCQCGQVLIRRHGLRVIENSLQEGDCPLCGAAIAGVWEGQVQKA